MSGQNTIGMFVQPNTNNVGIGTTAPRALLDVQGGNAIFVNGNVGIGTTVPSQALHVVGDILTTGTLKASNISAIGDFVTLNTITSNTEQVVVTNAGTGPALKVTQTGANSIAEFYDDENILVLKVADGGNVGIGTATPLAKLHVDGRIFSTYMDGLTPQTAAPSAKYLRDTMGYSTSALYWIKHGSLPIQMYCDMVTDGGGWMCLAIEFSYSTYVPNNGGTKIDQYGYNYQSPPLFQGETGINYFWALPKLNSPLSITEMYAAKLNSAILNDHATSTAVTVSVTGQWPPNASYNATNVQSNGWCTSHYFGNATNRFEWFNGALQNCSVNTASPYSGLTPRRIYKNNAQVSWNSVADTGTGTANNFGVIYGR